MNDIPREQMFEAEMLNQELGRMQEYMQRLEQQMVEVMQLKNALEEFRNVKQGDELLVPIAAGMFVQATAGKEKTLLINAGNNVVVPKTIEQTHEMLDMQLSEMKNYEGQIHQQFDGALAKLSAIEKKFSK